MGWYRGEPDRQVAVMNPIGLPFVAKLIPTGSETVSKLRKVQVLNKACGRMAYLMVWKSKASCHHLAYLVNDLSWGFAECSF